MCIRDRGYDVTATIYTFTDKPATVTHTHTASAVSYTHLDVYKRQVPTVYCCNVVYENSVGRLLLTEEGLSLIHI